MIYVQALNFAEYQRTAITIATQVTYLISIVILAICITVFLIFIQLFANAAFYIDTRFVCSYVVFLYHVFFIMLALKHVLISADCVVS